MSSRFRPRLRLLVAGVLVLAGVALLAALAGASAEKNPHGNRAPTPPPAGTAVDDSTAFALGMLNEMRALYGGDDAWARIEGFRYDITFTIPGPGGAPVRTWTESHTVWTMGEPRARLDVLEDSTTVIVAGDTTRVFRDGRWSTDSLVVGAARAQALDVIWAWHLPRNLVDRRLRLRQLDPNVKGEPFSTRAYFERPGLPRPQGTVLTVTFAPPTYAMRKLHWYDPRAGAWYLLELADDRMRYGFTWAERRTLHASDAAGEAGPVLWTAVLTDFQIEPEPQMPAVVLHPPGAGVGVVAARPQAPADTTAHR